MKALTKNNIPFYRFHSLPANGRLQHAVFTRQGGISPAPFATLNLSASVGDDRGRVYANRRLAYGTHGRDSHQLVHAHLIHSAGVARVTQADNGQHAGPTDGLITNEPGCGLTMNFADCAPIFLYDPERKAIGLGHAGWQGAVKDLPGALVRAMQEAFGSRPEKLLATVGPCIGPCCYEVGKEVIEAAAGRFPDAASLLIDNGGPRPHFDLPQANRQNLRAAGVRQIELANLCTACRTDLFFSHRAEKGKTGRFGVLFML